MPLTVTRVESLRPGSGPAVTADGASFAGRLWREVLDTALPPLATFDDGLPAWVCCQTWHYLATWPEGPLMDAVIAKLAREAGLNPGAMDEGVRVRSRAGLRFAFNFTPEDRPTPAPRGARYVLGGPVLAPAGVAAWRVDPP
jgi:beta-galactosidase